jgi:biotin carboxylase
MKRLMLLGGDHFLVPVVKAAKALGYYVITCDYLPDNIAHKYSDKYINHSTIDKDAILEDARRLGIDGIMTYTDSGVVSAAYVAHHLGLPMPGPLNSVEILQNKARFRNFLKENGFNVPKAKGYSSAEEALNDTEFYALPVMVKPVDAAGSKGVTKVESWDELQKAINWAVKFSFSGDFIIEEWIEKKGRSSDSDCFSYKGKITVCSFSSQWFDEQSSGPFVPAAFSWPSTYSHENESVLSMELQRLITLLGMQSSVYNIETRIGTDDKPYIMEVSPRGGGNRLSEMVFFSTGVDIISNACRVAVGDAPVGYNQKPLKGHWAEIILHSQKQGRLLGVTVAERIKPCVREIDLWYNVGEQVPNFKSARDTIGTLVLQFQTEEELLDALENQQKWLRVVVE